MAVIFPSAGQFGLRPSVYNSALQQVLQQSGYNLDGSDFAGFVKSVSFSPAINQWGPTKLVGGFTGLNYTFNGGTAITATGAFVHIADGSIVLADNTVNYVERNYAGTVTTNTVGFTATKVPMAKVTTAGGTITAVEDWRPIQGQFLYFPTKGTEVGVISVEYAYSDPRRYGVVFTPNGDNIDYTAQWNNAWQSLYNRGGGKLECPEGRTRSDGAWLIPNDGAATPKQPSMRLTGAGAGHAGQTGSTLGGTILDLRYAGGGVAVAKIDTRGLGLLEIDRVNLIDDGLSTTPFVQTTNTTLKAHHNRVQGNPTKSGLTCDQDAFILGGTGTIIDGSSNAPFQGYGTDIHDNCFARIRRGVYGRSFCNDIDFHRNWFLHNCGTNLVGTLGAAIEFLGSATDADSGNRVIANTVEMGAYPYMVRLERCVHNTVAFNGGFDATATTLGYVRCEATAQYNIIIPGFSSDTIPYLSDANNPSAQTLISSHQTRPSNFAQGFTAPGGQSVFNGGFGPQLTDAAGDYWDHLVTLAELTGRLIPAGGAAESVYGWHRYAADQHELQIRGATLARVYAPDGNLVLKSAASPGYVQVGDAVCGGVLGVSKAGFYGTAPIAKPAVTGSRGGNAALASLLTQLAALGLITDSTTV